MGEIIKCFVDDYYRCGGPKLDLEEVLLRYRLAYITFVYDACQWIERDLYKQMPKEEIAKFTGEMDDGFQAAFRVRCRSMTVINGFGFYLSAATSRLSSTSGPRARVRCTCRCT